MYSTSYFRYLMMDESLIPRVVPWTLRIRLLIMTSNIGSSYLLDGIDEQGNIRSEAEYELL